ncbi:MAG TPA: hypothetical protein VGV40_06065 [Solirubrobacteraceae bacterium]|nr:hypothetical protein [Solirubrobacteraceae bacterium]
MAALAWVMMGIALWHFAIFVPDRFWGGIVGAFAAATIGSVLVALAFHGFTVPPQEETSALVALEAVPGTLLGLAIAWLIGARQERAASEG